MSFYNFTGTIFKNIFMKGASGKTNYAMHPYLINPDKSM